MAPRNWKRVLEQRDIVRDFAEQEFERRQSRAALIRGARDLSLAVIIYCAACWAAYWAGVW